MGLRSSAIGAVGLGCGVEENVAGARANREGMGCCAMVGAARRGRWQAGHGRSQVLALEMLS